MDVDIEMFNTWVHRASVSLSLSSRYMVDGCKCGDAATESLANFNCELTEIVTPMAICAERLFAVYQIRQRLSKKDN